jgi:membrane-associated phospholipid phosphatase
MPKQNDPLDVISIVYGLSIAALIGILVGQATTGLALLLLNLSVGLAALLALPRLRARGGLRRFFGVTLPLLVFYLYYRETAVVLNQRGITWLDRLVAGPEMQVWENLASDPGSPFFGEVFALGYMAYVPLLLVVAVALLRDPNRGPTGHAESYVRWVCISWSVCYILFLVIPVLGPRFAFPGLQEPRMGDGPFSFIARLNGDHGMVRGAAFPSAHVAATAIALWSVWCWRRAWFRWLLPAGLCLAVGAVYLGYHYVVDVLAGILVGAVAVAFDRITVRRRLLSGSWSPRPTDLRQEGKPP